MNISEFTRVLNEATNMDWGEPMFDDGVIFWVSGEDKAAYNHTDILRWSLTIEGIKGIGNTPAMAFQDINVELNPDMSTLRELEETWPLTWERRQGSYSHSSTCGEGESFITATPDGQDPSTGETLWALNVRVYGMPLEQSLEHLRGLCSRGYRIKGEP